MKLRDGLEQMDREANHHIDEFKEGFPETDDLVIEAGGEDLPGIRDLRAQIERDVRASVKHLSEKEAACVADGYILGYLIAQRSLSIGSD